eukprot:Phypoly_transcript_21581.p1 GENE.Phypoly_transcript_21581~~Phypoly_transcript_21581.p1  ORF type:complete len:125 (+),score=25.92 Phypoly_transcript_21581:259-633(+)
MAKLNINELRSKKKSELLQKLTELKNELATLRVAQVTGGAPSRLAKIRVVRKSIARVLLVIGQNQKLQLRQYYSDGKKLKPLDLRVKKTRAQRRALKPSERRVQSARVAKRNTAFPQRKFAVKA